MGVQTRRQVRRYTRYNTSSDRGYGCGSRAVAVAERQILRLPPGLDFEKTSFPTLKNIKAEKDQALGLKLKSSALTVPDHAGMYAMKVAR